MSFEQIHRGCVDKTGRYHSRRTAEKVAAELGMHCYRCRFCGEWHLTSKH